MNNSSKGRIIIYLPTLVLGGGVLSHSLELAEGFERHGYEVIFLPKGKGPREFWKRTLFLGGNDFTRPLRLKSLAEELKPIAVLSNMYHQNMTLGISRLLYPKPYRNVKLIGIFHNALARKRRGQAWKLPYRLYSKMVLERFDTLVAVSGLVKKDIKEAMFIKDEKVRVIYNPINTARILEMSKEDLEPEIQKIFDENRVIINTSRFTDQKRIDLLIRIFSLVKEEEDRVKLMLVGSGSEENSLRELVKKLKLERDVVFLPYTSNPFKYIARSYLFALTSEHEGFGRVLAEAGVLGVPSVSFYNDYTASPEAVVHDKTGYLIPFGDLEGFARAVIDLLRNPEKRDRFGEEAKRFALKFDSEKIVREFLNLIEN